MDIVRQIEAEIEQYRALLKLQQTPQTQIKIENKRVKINALINVANNMNTEKESEPIFSEEYYNTMLSKREQDLRKIENLKHLLGKIEKSIELLGARAGEEEEVVLGLWYRMYELKNKTDRTTEEEKKYNELRSALRKRENKMWDLQERMVRKINDRKKIKARMYRRFCIPNDESADRSISRSCIPYENKYYPTPQDFVGKNVGGKALIVGCGPSTERILKYRDVIKEKFDVVIGLNVAVVDFGDVMDYHLVIDRLPSWIIHKLQWFLGDIYDKQMPRILNWKSAHRFPQDLNIVQTPRCNFGGKPDIRKFRHNGYEGLLSGTITRAGLAAGAILAQAIHLTGILGCSEVYTIGADFLFDEEKDHYYEDKLYRENNLKTKPRNKSLIVQIEHKGKKYWTLEYFLDSAEYINNDLVDICKAGGLQVHDFSGGLLRDDIQLDLEKFFEK